MISWASAWMTVRELIGGQTRLPTNVQPHAMLPTNLKIILLPEIDALLYVLHPPTLETYSLANVLITAMVANLAILTPVQPVHPPIDNVLYSVHLVTMGYSLAIEHVWQYALTKHGPRIPIGHANYRQQTAHLQNMQTIILTSVWPKEHAV